MEMDMLDHFHYHNHNDFRYYNKNCEIYNEYGNDKENK